MNVRHDSKYCGHVYVYLYVLCSIAFRNTVTTKTPKSLSGRNQSSDHETQVTKCEWRTQVIRNKCRASKQTAKPANLKNNKALFTAFVELEDRILRGRKHALFWYTRVMLSVSHHSTYVASGTMQMINGLILYSITFCYFNTTYPCPLWLSVSRLVTIENVLVIGDFTGFF